MFIHLHVHSYYSLLEGLASPADLAQAASQQGMQALALTDHNLLSGAVEFYDACLAAGVRPILGLEIEVAVPPELTVSARNRDSRLVLLASGQSGWASLCRLSSAVHGLSPGQMQALAFEKLAENTSGLVCLSGGRLGSASQFLLEGNETAARAYLHRLADLFPGSLYVQLQRHSRKDASLLPGLVSLARGLGLPCAATGEVYYLRPAQAPIQRLVAAIRLNRSRQELEADMAAPPGAHFSSPDEMSHRFQEFPEAIAAIQEIAERCRLELPLGIPHYPQISLPPGDDALQVLRRRAEAGLSRSYPEITPALQSRLDHELSVIGALGYAPLFHIMDEILQFARRKGVPVSSRGSAASSLVAHCLEITSPDPVRLNLYFERFLNPARNTPPDIDTDLCSRRRDEVIDFVYERYGRDRVAMVATINRFRPRSALRETAKAYGLPSAEVKSLAESLPSRGWGPPTLEVSNAAPYSALAKRYPSATHQAIFREAAQLIGIPRHLSIHPGGVVISPGPLTDLAPTLLAAKGVLITQFDLESVERFGLLKIDMLGIRGLTVIGDVAQAIHAAQASASQARSSSPIEALESIPEEDPQTSDLVMTGNTIGCFQIESPGMRVTLKEIQARSVDDLMIALALYRPGPLTGGLKEAFVRRHRGQEPASYLHPSLVSLLEDTHGVILYQEQVLRIAHELAGLSLADADLLRRAMSHFDPGRQMQTLKERFIEGAATRHGVPEEVGERIWELMAAFAGYGFPKAHAASYALVAWRAAWCKAHYPEVFMAAVLANWGGYYSQRIYLTEARRMGLSLRPPHINFARREFSVGYQDGNPVLYMGLDQVRDLTRRTQSRILRQRPFHSLADFLARADPRSIEAENLVRVGALAGLGNIPTLITRLGEGSRLKGQLPLFDFSLESQDQGRGEDWTLEEKVAAQEAILGTGVDAHPLELVKKKLEELHALSTVEAAASIGQRVRVAGMRQTWHRSRTVRGDYFYLMSLEDLEGMLDALIGADVHRRNKAVLESPGPYVLEGLVEMNRNKGEPYIRVEQIWGIR